MRILLERRGNGVTAFDADTHDYLGVGSDADGALGAAVDNLVICNGSVTIDEILSDNEQGT